MSHHIKGETGGDKKTETGKPKTGTAKSGSKPAPKK